MCVTDRCGAKQNNNIVIRIDMKKRLTLTVWGLLVAFSVMAEAVKVTSPDGEYEFTVSDDGQLSYSLFYQQKEVIEPSRLGIEWNENWYDGIRIVTSRNS